MSLKRNRRFLSLIHIWVPNRRSVQESPVPVKRRRKGSLSGKGKSQGSLVPWDDLPEDCVFEILRNVEISSLDPCACVSRTWSRVSTSRELVWVGKDS